MKAPSFVGGAGIAGWTGLKGFQGLDGQWKGWSFPASKATSEETEAVVSSSEDSSLGEDVEGGLVSKIFLSGDQPGGRRLVNS